MTATPTDHNLILAIDQGTTSSRAVIWNPDSWSVQALIQQEFPQHYPRSGWVEHDPDDLLSSVVHCVREALRQIDRQAQDIRAIGITNQRETTILWDRRTGKPIHRAIVWQDRRTASSTDHLRTHPLAATVRQKTGLQLDPYFCASKIQWILNNVDQARTAADAGHLLFGTVETFLIWHLTGGVDGGRHVTDATNASRTMLFDIHHQRWDPDLCALFGIPAPLLPEVLDCADHFGTCQAQWFGSPIAITGVAGDQHAALIGQAGFVSGDAKMTYGTGAFLLHNTGQRAVPSEHGLLTTVAWRLGGQITYALEGSIFVAGAVNQWLRDGLGLIQQVKETELLAQQARDDQEITIVPAFTGLGAPYWCAEARGAVFGLARNTGPAELARACLQSIGLQSDALYQAINADLTSHNIDTPDQPLRVDGGLSSNDWAMQDTADTLGRSLLRPVQTETTVLGAGWLAAHTLGLAESMDQAAAQRPVDRIFTPQISSSKRDQRRARWQACVEAVMSVHQRPPTHT